MANTKSYKYICIVLFIILILVVLFLIWKQSFCRVRVEKMKNFGEPKGIKTNTRNAAKLNPKPDTPKEFDLSGMGYKKFDILSKEDKDENISKFFDFPKPMDDRPDLAQCQPCICPPCNNKDDILDDKIIRKYIAAKLQND